MKMKYDETTDFSAIPTPKVNLSVMVTAIDDESYKRSLPRTPFNVFSGILQLLEELENMSGADVMPQYMERINDWMKLDAMVPPIYGSGALPEIE